MEGQKYHAKPNRMGRDDSEWLVVDENNRSLTHSMPKQAAEDLAAAWNMGAQQLRMEVFREAMGS